MNPIEDIYDSLSFGNYVPVPDGLLASIETLKKVKSQKSSITLTIHTDFSISLQATMAIVDGKTVKYDLFSKALHKAIAEATQYLKSHRIRPLSYEAFIWKKAMVRPSHDYVISLIIKS